MMFCGKIMTSIRGIPSFLASMEDVELEDRKVPL